MNCQRFSVAICGGGIGGLTCALALSKYPDIDVTLFEASAKFCEIGAGIGILRRPWQVLKALGLAEDLVQCTECPQREGPVPTFNLRKSDQPEGFDFYTIFSDGGISTFHRADFQGVLLKHLPRSCNLRLSKRLSSYHQSQRGPIKLVFEDGSTAMCDILIGADGIKSPTRRSLLRETARLRAGEKSPTELLSSVDPVWSGTVAYRALISADDLKRRAPEHKVMIGPTIYLGKSGQCVAYPISHGRSINVAAFHVRHELENTPYGGPWISSVDKSEFTKATSDWEPEVRALLSCTDKMNKWAIHTVKPLSSYVHGRVALIGDAAHAMAPYQGSGAGQAIEDAYFLATLLGHPNTTLDSASFALQVYDSFRRPFASKVAEMSRLCGQYYTLKFDDVDFDDFEGAGLKHKLQDLGEAITRSWEWSWTTTLDESLQAAIKVLVRS